MKLLTSTTSVAFYLLLCSSAFPQGSLTPPAPPGPTMLTLDQIGGKIDAVAAKAEARIPIDGAHTPGDNTTNLFVINQAGSYYLTGNITGVKGMNGISVQTDNVTIDLNGFTLQGVAGALSGIDTPRRVNNLVVERGGIRDWPGDGITAADPSNSPSFAANGARFTSVYFGYNGGYGVRAGNGALVRQCVAEVNGQSGFLVGVSSVLENCISRSNGVAGYFSQILGVDPSVIGDVEAPAIFRGCTAEQNSSSGFVSDFAALSDCSAYKNAGNGFKLTYSSAHHCSAISNTGGFEVAAVLLDGCNASQNEVAGIHGAGTFKDCHLDSNYGAGISVSDTSNVTGCVVNETSGDGILVAIPNVNSTHPHGSMISHCVVSDTAAIAGPFGGPGVGIHLKDTQDCEVLDNNLTGNASYGILVDGASTLNVIARNVARLNSQNYVINLGNRVAAIVVPTTNKAQITGANAGSTDGFTGIDPWANFSY